MPKTRIALSRDITERLRAFEHALNETMHLGGLVAAELPRASITAKVAPEVGNAAIGHVLSSLARMHEARTEIMLGHGALEDVRRRLGLPVVSTGDKYEGIEQEPTLRAVA